MLIEATLLIATMMPPAVSLRAPTVGATCYRSQFAHGTDNVPVSNARATIVINIWVVREGVEAAPISGGHG